METRGVWITTTDSKVLNSRQNIAAAMDFLAQTGFNVVFPVIWNSAFTLYPSKVMRDNFGVEIDPRYRDRDPLAEMVTEARRVGLAVIPWFEYGFAASYNQNGGHILAKKPDWGARDNSGNLVKKNSFEWMNALDSEVQEFLLNLVLEVVKNYEISGIQGDDRLPALPSEGGYDRRTSDRYFQQFLQNPPQNPKDPQWLQWRADILTDFLTRLYQEVINIKPDLLISLAPSPHGWALQEYLQDPKAWSDRGLVDMMHPQLYRRDFSSYKQLVDSLVAQQFTAAQLPTLIPGILLKVGGYRISAEYLLQAIAYNRFRGIQGEVFFFYEGLREDNDALAKALRSGPYSQPEPFNPSQLKQLGFTSRRIGGKYSYIDTTGKSVSQPQFDWVDSFHSGLARVKMGYKWSFIDNTGKLISRFQFDSAEYFREGMAAIKIGSKYGYLDNTGKLVVPLQFDEAKSFSEGLAAVKIENKWGYIDRRNTKALDAPQGWINNFLLRFQTIFNPNTLTIPPQFDSADAFSEGMARIGVGGKYGYIDTTGKLVILPQFEDAKSFSEKLAAVKLVGKWQYIDRTGKVVILPQFEDAGSFLEGLAAVKIAGKWGYINKIGKLVIPTEFDNAQSFSQGLALVNIGGSWRSGENGELSFSGGKWGYIRNVLS
ncbi:WG repeat-containing protein [Coleofasciculus sp. FACHB-501]|uniref:WG repeat-containing protein n=1 Tax=Cyanophyceae TaxID=3028117 RepID=UPI0016886B27|nr:WG repeat-containing protein [Coleofasciculus sp. FACHB-501]MBD1839564.1 WG repeat-containing protein [Coleofasciculus sp. FACHB-501]